LLLFYDFVIFTKFIINIGFQGYKVNTVNIIVLELYSGYEYSFRD